ncbi:MAG: hypothetical protein H0X37_03250 [Herpetosiphonaceae bacterium]|nr:hypothetical protein [Herpetosiphonaceae bacterium]
MKGKRQPAWWTLYLWCAVGMVLLFGEHFMPVSAGWHKLLEVLVVLCLFGVTAIWLRCNAAALEAEARDRERRAAAAGVRRNVPLTPIQSYYLDVMDQQQGREDATWVYTPHERARFSEHK